MSDQSDYYLNQKEKLCRGHQAMMALGQPLMADRYGHEFARTAVQQSRSEFEALIPEIPYIGGKNNPMTDTLVQMTSLLALYRVLRAYGRPVAEIGQLAIEMSQAWIDRYPAFLPRLVGMLYMSRLNRRLMAQKMAQSQQRHYPGDFVRELILSAEGDDFEWGINYLECGIVKFFTTQGAEEFTPFMCEIDHLIFPAMGITLQRSGTIAKGCSHCDFRFRRD